VGVSMASASADAVVKASEETEAVAKASSASQTTPESIPVRAPTLQKAATTTGAPAATGFTKTPSFSDGHLPPPMKPINLSRAASEATPAKKNTFGLFKSARGVSHTPRRSGFFGFKKKRRPNKAAMKKAIKDILLSPAVSTELAGQDIPKDPLKRPSREEVLTMLKLYVPDIAKMKGRRGRLKVVDLIMNTVVKGLPTFKGDLTLTNHIKSSLLFILHTCIMHSTSTNPDKATTSSHKMIIDQLVDAFQACQAVQARVIDTLYGIISCRDKSLADQLLVIVDAQKQLALNKLVNQVFKNAWTASDKTPQLQVPHLQNGMRRAFGERFGLTGVRAAKIDASANKQVATKLKEQVTKLYERFFFIEEVVTAFINDVNAADSESSRIINRDDLAKWAGSPIAKDRKFEPFSIYYDEEVKDRYSGPPAKEQEYQPYLNEDVALDILYTVFVMDDKTQKLRKARLKQLNAVEKAHAAAAAAAEKKTVEKEKEKHKIKKKLSFFSKFKKKKTAKKPVKATWQWMDDSGWKNYQADQQAKLETSFQKKESELVLMTPRAYYSIDFKGMFQTNLATNGRRKVRRHEK